jgi:Flp pilus assembly protein TadG
MNIYTCRKGQALVETALILILIMMISLAITEFSRAWFTKNSTKNAVRQGARTAAVTDNLTPFGLTACPIADPCSSANEVLEAVCCESVGVKRAHTQVSLTFDDKDSSGDITTGDAVTVTASFNEPGFFIVGGGTWPWASDLVFDVDASMRYE